jgi:mono/diheme cytochrome c family protein
VTPRRANFIVVFGTVLVATAGGCDRLDMYDQPRYEPLEASTFFPDGMSARPRIDGTISRGELHEDIVVHTGRDGERLAPTIPAAVYEMFYRRDHGVLGLPEELPGEKELRRLLLYRGRERFDIYCSACHGRTGEGDGIVVERGFRAPPSYLNERLRDAPAGHFFDVMSRGFGAMPAFAARVDEIDRWAIAAYIRALQLSGRAALDDVSPDDRSRLDRPSSATEERR